MARKVTSRRVWVSTGAAWLFGFLIFLPILWMVLTSFKTELEAFAMPPTFLFFHWTTENYATVQGRSDYLHHALNSILVAGGSSKVPGLLEALRQEFSLPVEILNPFQRITPPAEGLGVELIDNNAGQLAVAVGLALRSFEEL